MYVTVKLLNGWPQPLTYKIPPSWSIDDLQGALVTVPLQKRFEQAVIENVFDQDPSFNAYTIKEVHAYDVLLNDPLYKKFIAKLSSYYALDNLSLYRRFWSFLTQKEIDDYALISPSLQSIINCTPPTLTEEQQVVADGIAPYLQQGRYQACVIHGVTGSGKTEVYHSLMSTAHAQNKAVVFLVPEVSLAVRFTRLFRERYQEAIPIFGFHSASSAKEKKMLLQALRAEQPAIIIGVHLPVLLPMKHLGLIIIDEEHEIGYQEKKHPRINTKESALLRAQLHQIPIVLGSATPSISTLYNVQTRGWKMFTIRKRFAGAFPKINIVKLTNKEKRPSFWISKELELAIRERLSKKEQVIIFINRRGYSFFIQCESCGFIFKCTNCSVSLTFHEGDTLRCHYCGLNQNLPPRCRTCPSTNFLKKGIGTQQVVTLLQRLFPTARIGRADLDTTINRKKWQETLTSFYNQELDILVGTQTITKGYHFPQVTLVGILWADMHLSMPTYNAAETTLQQLIQVAGRAGRQHPESLVIVQTMLEHTLLSYVDEVKYLDFYTYELGQRALMRYPPLVRFAEIELLHKKEEIVEQESLYCAEVLQNAIKKARSHYRYSGPPNLLFTK